MNFPQGNVNAGLLECVSPCHDVVVDAIHLRAIQIEEHGGERGLGFGWSVHCVL
jgi:hypothetical protein